MNIKVQVDGLDRVAGASRKVRESVARELLGALKLSGERVRGEAIKSILAGGKTGTVYKRGNVLHQASAPGEAPAQDTGRLASSITTSVDGTSVIVTAGNGTVKYARMLEFGTSRIAARPFMMPAYRRSKAWIKERLNRAVSDGIRNGSK